MCSHRPAGSGSHADVPASRLWRGDQGPAPEASGPSPCPQRARRQNPERGREDGAGERVSMETVQHSGDGDDHHQEGQVRGDSAKTFDLTLCL